MLLNILVARLIDPLLLMCDDGTSITIIPVSVLDASQHVQLHIFSVLES